MSEAGSQPVLFEAELAPNPPMAPRFLAAVLVVVAGLSLIFAVYFIARGAWPVTPFLGADVALLAWALQASVRASYARERLTLTAQRFVVQRTSPRGQQSTLEVNPYWLRVEFDDPERMGRPLTLVGQGKRLVVGGFLGADDRASLAAALKTALRKVHDWRSSQ